MFFFHEFSQVNEYRYEIERVTRELQDVKRKFFEQKRKDQIEAERQRADENDPLIMQQTQFHQTQPKITGGGFNLQATVPAQQAQAL